MSETAMSKSKTVFYSCKTGKSKTEVGVGWGGAWWRVVVYM